MVGAWGLVVLAVFFHGFLGCFLGVVVLAEACEVGGGVVVGVAGVVYVCGAGGAALSCVGAGCGALVVVALEDVFADGVPVGGEGGCASGFFAPGHVFPWCLVGGYAVFVAPFAGDFTAVFVPVLSAEGDEFAVFFFKFDADGFHAG